MQIIIFGGIKKIMGTYVLANILSENCDFEYNSRTLEDCSSYFVHFEKAGLFPLVFGIPAPLPTWMKGPPRRV